MPVLPAELLERILECISEEDTAHRVIVAKECRRVYKRGVAVCSLVCRYWTVRLQPLIFHSITLRSSQDLADFILLLNQPNTQIPYAVQSLELEEDKVAWAHCAFISLVRKLHNLTSLKLVNTSRWSYSTTICRARPPQFFKLLPALCSQLRTLQTLEFHGVVFPSLFTLAACAGALPNVTRLKFKEVDCINKTERFPSVRAAWHLRGVAASQCHVQWYSTWLLLSTSKQVPDCGSAHRRPSLGASDIQAILSLLRMAYAEADTCFADLEMLASDSEPECEWAILNHRLCVLNTV